MSTTAHSGKGLEGITAANSSICFIDGDQGVLGILQGESSLQTWQFGPTDVTFPLDAGPASR